ncbi:MAG TPA: cytochrome C [Telluria sp.]|nr:cytochrome C [Telluria sp.]
MTSYSRIIRALACALVGDALGAPTIANALPSFARQTGQQCATCHAGGQFPELTPFGRMFKLTGYTIGTRTIPLSAMAVASMTKSSTPTEDVAFARDAVALFQTASVFVAGKITDKSGIFAQATYNNYDHQDPVSGRWRGKWGSDNLDLRYADHATVAGKDVIVGLDLNNNPSISDPWNTAPAWMQYVPTQFGVTGPDAAPLVSQLGAQAVGLGAYAMWNGLVYVEASLYQTANGAWSFASQGTSNADQVKLKGVNPYLRLALGHEWGPHSAMIGMLALNGDVYPDNLNPVGPSTQYRDRGVDAQYQYALGPHAVTAQLSYIHESISHGDVTEVAANASNRLNQLKLKATYSYQAKYGASLGYFSTTGTSDAVLYPDAASNPDTRGWVPELYWIPEQHLRAGIQYFAYDRFHGARTNYDGAGRDARDNNTLFVYLWGNY